MGALTTESTHFTRDVQGRYVCNTFLEAQVSADKNPRPDAGRPEARPDARPFDIIIIGGGSFGGVLASHLFDRDLAREHRILVLEAGPFVLPEHTQNLPMLNTNEVWGVPWNSDSPKSWNQQFPGLAYCVGGRSVFFGGWSPYLLDSEMPTPPWPPNVKKDLQTTYMDEAARQLGTDTTNDFVFGSLHEALRDQLFKGLKSRSGNQPTTLTGNRGSLKTVDDLEAPLAVQSAAPRPGFFPFNKFSAVPLLIRAARLAEAECRGDDVQKRLMIVNNTHIIRLERLGRRITRIVTNQGTIDVPEDGRVFLALGTIENTRIALNTLPNQRGLIGRNLMAHLRSNVTIRVPRSSFSSLQLKELQVSALFVKGIYKHHDGSLGHFHVQITASGAGQLGMNSEAELFQKVPDIDGLDKFRNLTDKYIVLTLRGIGEMTGDKTSIDPLNRITLDNPQAQGPYDYGTPRALVRLEAPPGSKEQALWDALDKACDEIALVFANGGPIEYQASQNVGVWQSTPPGRDARRDPLSSTHHEGGTLWMGTDPTTSVTDQWGRFHEADNLSAVGPVLLPTLGSPNPMLSGVALARRIGDHIIPDPQPEPLESGFKYLFDGTGKTMSSWQAVGAGGFALLDGTIVAQPGGDLGLLYYAAETFGNFTLRLQFRLDRVDDNSGVFVRFQDPRQPVPDPKKPGVSFPYSNQAWVGVDTGFEVQIDELARGDVTKGTPDGLEEHRTGAIYNIPLGMSGGTQAFQRGPVLEAGKWNDYEIEVIDNIYRVRLNGQLTTVFTNQDKNRGKPPQNAADRLYGYIGLQAHTGRVAFRNVRVCAGKAAPLKKPVVESHPARGILRFLPGWRQVREGELVQGGRLVIEYDPARQTACRQTVNGMPNWDIVAYVRFQPSGQLYSGSVLQHFQGDPPRAVIPLSMMALDIPVPHDATQAELWFNNLDRGGCGVWDSRFGQSYWEGVIHHMPAPIQLVQYRYGAIPSLEMVNVLADTATKRNVFPFPETGPRQGSDLLTRLFVAAWVRNVAFVKNVWVDIHVFDENDMLIQAQTLPLRYVEHAGGNGDLFMIDRTIYQGSVATPESVSQKPDARRVEYRVYYEVNGQVYTDALLHEYELPEDAVILQERRLLLTESHLFAGDSQ